MPHRTAILGASDKPERYAYLALQQLRTHGDEVLPVHPTLSQIEGIPVLRSLQDLSSPVDTLTLYVGPAISSQASADIIALRPGRVIFNPGTENPTLQAELTAAGIAWQEACTLVMLRTGQW